MLKGIDITLYETTLTGVDEFKQPVYSETATTVSNVLVAPTSATENLSNIEMNGKKAIYTLAIPKGDTHDWIDKKVEFFGATWHTFGEPLKGIDDLIPLNWNMKVMVEHYE